MFNFNEESLKKQRDEAEAKRMANKMMKDMLSDILLGGDGPEEIKMPVRIINTHSSINDALDNLIKKHVVKEVSKDDLEKFKTIYEYLQMVEVGIKQFIETLENGEKEND